MPYADPKQKAAYQKRYQAAHAEELREYHAAYNIAYYAANKDKWTEVYGPRQAQKNRDLKLRIFRHYSRSGVPSCQCCGESELGFLTLEHLNGGGRQHRRGKNPGTVYQEIIDAGFPEDYSVLCYNCNCSKKVYRVCPHESALSAITGS